MSNEEKIISFITGSLLEDQFDLEADTSLFQDRLLDSLNLVMLINYLENEFGIKIATSEVSIENLDTVARMVAFVAQKQV